MSQPEVLLTVPSVELHQVQHQQDELLQQGPLSLLVDHTKKPSDVVASCGAVSWNLRSTLPCLKSDDRTYIFSLHDRPGVFYCVIIAPGTPPFVVDALEGVLTSSCDFSTMQQPSGASSSADTVRGVPAVVDGQPASTQPSKMSQQVSGGLVRAGEIGAACLVGLAGLTATGIQKIANVTVKNTTPAPNGQMAPETRAKLEKAKDVISQAGSVLSKFATSAGSMAGNATQSMSRSLSKNETMKKVSTNPDVQVLGSASMTAGGHLLAGLKDAARIVAQSTETAMKHYHAKKYPAEAYAATTPAGVPAGSPAFPAAGPAAAYPHPPPPIGAAPAPGPVPMGATPAPGSMPSGPAAPTGYPPASYPAVPPGPPAGYPGGSASPAQPAAPAAAPGLYPEVQQPTLYPPPPTNPHA